MNEYNILSNSDALNNAERKRSFLSASSERLSIARSYIYSKYMALKAVLYNSYQSRSIYGDPMNKYDSGSGGNGNPMQYYGQGRAQFEAKYLNKSSKSGLTGTNGKHSINSTLAADQAKEDELLRSDLLESSAPSLKDVTYDEYAEKRANYLMNRLGSGKNAKNELNEKEISDVEGSKSGNMGFDESLGSSCDNPLFAKGARKKKSGPAKPELSTVNIFDGIEERLDYNSTDNAAAQIQSPKNKRSVIQGNGNGKALSEKETKDVEGSKAGSMGLDESLGSSCDNPLFAKGARKKKSGPAKPELSTVNILDGIEQRLDYNSRINAAAQIQSPRNKRSVMQGNGAGKASTNKEGMKMQWSSPLPPGME